MTISRAAPLLYTTGLFTVAVFAPVPGLSILANGVVAALLAVYATFLWRRLDRVTLLLALLPLPHLIWMSLSYFWSVDRELAVVALIATVTSTLTYLAALLLSRHLPRSPVVQAGILLAVLTHLVFAGLQYRETPYIRLSGITENANLLAFILLLLWFLYALLSDRRTGPGAGTGAGAAVTPRAWGLQLLLYGATFAVVLGTASKKALPGFLLVSVALWLRHRRAWRQGWTVLGLLLGGGLLALTLSAVNLSALVGNVQGLRITRRLAEFLTGNNSDDVRYDMIREAGVLFAQRPLTGHGMQSFSLLGSYGTYSHNTYLELLASLGLLGVVTFLLPFLVSPLLLRYHRTATLLVLFLLLWSWGAVVFDLKMFWWVLGTLLGSLSVRTAGAPAPQSAPPAAQPT